ncbi:lysophospholipase NTE1 [Fusarium mundagurra]|uniref:Lysophospholipase NTE1 n=1 Tax=Fusarium mundagurra TaxID=1567541 RepID=A0A8H5XRU9_9HYPO|nr:lysophospholipase NTE1 [Fusarium mundagurra]
MKTVNIAAGHTIEPWHEFPLSLVLVVKGTITVTVSGLANLPFHVDPEHEPGKSSSPEAFKTINPGGFLNSTCQLLSALLGTEISLRDPYTNIVGAKVGFSASTDVAVCVIPLTELGGRCVPEDVGGPVAQALLRKIYFVAFRYAKSHFSLHDQVLRCETQLNKLVNSVPILDGLSPTSLDLPVGNSFTATLQSPDSGPALVNASLSNGINATSLSGPISNHTSEAFLNTPNLGLMPRERRRSFLRLQTVTPPTPVSDDADARSFFCFSPSALSYTERKEKAFILHSSEDESDILAKKTFVAQTLFRVLDGEASGPRDQEVASSGFHDAVASIKILSLKANACFAHENERYPGFFVLLEGQVNALYSKAEPSKSTKNSTEASGEQQVAFTLGQPSLIGYSCMVTNNRSMFSFRAVTPAIVGFLPRASVHKLVEKRPGVMLKMGHRMLSVLSPILSLTDFALDWSTFKAGQEIYRKGDPSDSIYFVFTGRVRTVEDIAGSDEKRVKEVGSGKSFGALDLYTGNRRQSAVLATRRSEIVRLQKSSYQALVNCCPSVAFSIWDNILRNAPDIIRGGKALQSDAQSRRFRTIAVLPLSAEVSVDRFVSLLSTALVDVGVYSHDEVMQVRSELIINSVGKSVFSDAGNIQLEDYLAHLQENVELSILPGDHSVDSTWNDICIANADCIILVGLDDSDPVVSPVELRLERSGSMAQRMLALIESDEQPEPTPVTKSWIENRPWILQGSHIMRVRTNPLSSTKDFERLARRLSGRAIAVVFGGGGARGFAHLGALKAFEEEGIPIDIIGGTSMGAFVGGLYATTASQTRAYQAAKSFSEKSRWYNYLADATAPVLAATSGSYLSSTVASAIGETFVSSDARLTFYCNVTNLSNGCQSHIMYPQARPLWQMIRASMGVPGVFPPFAMQGRGDLLVDGCFSANVPVFPALALGAEVVFAFDVSETPVPPAQELTRCVSGWRLASQLFLQCCCGKRRKRQDPGGEVVAYTNTGGTLTVPRILSLLSFSTNMNELRAIKETPECFYNRPPVGHIGAFAMDRIDEAQELGYRNAKLWLEELRNQGNLGHLALSK